FFSTTTLTHLFLTPFPTRRSSDLFDHVRCRESQVLQRGNDSYSGPCQQQTGNGSCTRQQNTFGEHLSHQTSSSRAKRAAYGHLPLPSDCPREQQVGDIGTGDQKYEGNRPKHH